MQIVDYVWRHHDFWFWRISCSMSNYRLKDETRTQAILNQCFIIALSWHNKMVKRSAHDHLQISTKKAWISSPVFFHYFSGADRVYNCSMICTPICGKIGFHGNRGAGCCCRAERTIYNSISSKNCNFLQHNSLFHTLGCQLGFTIS